MRLDELDIKVLRENFDDEMIKKIDPENIYKIFKYLKENGVYYAKDLFLSSFDLFLLPESEFIKHFEILKNKYNIFVKNKVRSLETAFPNKEEIELLNIKKRSYHRNLESK